MRQSQYGPTPEGWGLQGGQPPTSSGDPRRNWFLRHKITTAATSVLLLLFIVGIAKGAPPAPVDIVSPAAATSTATHPATTTSDAPATTSPTTTDAPAPTTSNPTTTVAPVPAPTTPAPATVRVVPAPLAPAPVPAPAPAPSGGSCGMDSYVNSSGNCVHDPVAAPSPPPGATAMCNDGTYSFSQHHSGTCSGHKGVALFYS